MTRRPPTSTPFPHTTLSGAAASQPSTSGKPVRRSAAASHSALAATSGACAGSAEIDGIRTHASRSACRSSRCALTKSRSGLLTPADGSVAAMAGQLLKVDVGGLTFDVRADGPDDGRPVLLLHGFPETSASWAAVTPRLSEAGLRTYAVDQLGYSPGARPLDVDSYALTNLAQVTADLMTAMDVPVADVVGHDWGANVAWTLAAWHEDRVRSLTAVSVPHPTAFTTTFRSDPAQKERSAYIRLFWQPGKAEEVLQIGRAHV